jgi:hypothetical protein
MWWQTQDSSGLTPYPAQAAGSTGRRCKRERNATDYSAGKTR